MESVQLVGAWLTSEQQRKRAEKAIARDVLVMFAEGDRTKITEAIRELSERSGMSVYEVRSKLTTIAMTHIMDISRVPLGCSCGCDTCDDD